LIGVDLAIDRSMPRSACDSFTSAHARGKGAGEGKRARRPLLRRFRGLGLTIGSGDPLAVVMGPVRRRPKAG
jgi:hypothetical protein